MEKRIELSVEKLNIWAYKGKSEDPRYPINREVYRNQTQPQYLSAQYYSHFPPPKKTKIPFYLAIITQLIIQMLLLIMITACTSQQSRNDFLFNPSGIWLLLWVVSSLLVVIGLIMIAITVIISMHYWSEYKDDNYLICVASVIIGLFFGGGSWLLAGLVT